MLGLELGEGYLRAAGVAAALALLGCYDPDYPLGLDCRESGRCPPGQTCVSGTCQLESDPGLDGGAGDGGAPATIEKLSLGGRHACVLSAGPLKRVRCWGDTARGRLGLGDPPWEDDYVGDDETPREVGRDTVVAEPAEGEVEELRLGAAHGCARIAVGGSGAIRCWGEDDSGKLGYGSEGVLEDVGDDEAPAEYLDGAFVPVGGSVGQIAAGSNHTCALVETRELEFDVRCWGSDGGGRGVLGYGGTNCEGRPHVGEEITPDACDPLGLSSKAVEIAAGSAHTCVILDNGFIQCWGDGEHGALQVEMSTEVGDDEAPSTFAPVMIQGVATGLALGSRHSCARTADGGVYCWGDASQRQLGPKADTARPGAVNAEEVPLPGAAEQIAAGPFHTCALVDGAVYCWGRNQCGELGRETTDTPIADHGDQPVDLGGRAIAIAAGRPASEEEGAFTCALLESGQVRCWGNASFGRLGYGSQFDDACVGDDPGESPAALGDVPIF